MPRMKVEPTSWKDLTGNQKQAIAWMVDNDKDHCDLIRETKVANNTVYAVWTVARIAKWKEFYRQHLLEQEPQEDRLDTQIKSLGDEAIRVIRDTLVTGEGNATAVRAAQWVLEAIFEDRAARKPEAPPAVQPATAERELATVLQMVRRK